MGLSAMEIVWDTKKAAINRFKHGVEFAHAVTSLEDPKAVTIEDDGHSEQRFVTVGADLFGRILVIVYAYGNEEEIRIISARHATAKERRQYEQP